MATIGTQSFHRLVSVSSSKLGEAVDLRGSFMEASLGEGVLTTFRPISPQIEALRTMAGCALSGGSVVLSGACGTGKSSLLYLLGCMLTVEYPGDAFTKLGDLVRDVQFVRSVASLRTAGRKWLLVLPDFSDGKFDYAMRGALNGALLNSPKTKDFVPADASLVEEYQETCDFLRKTGEYDGIVVLADNADSVIVDVMKNLQGENGQALTKFAEACSSSGFPMLFVAVLERDLSTLEASEENNLLSAIKKVQPMTLLGKDGEWEELVASSMLRHSDAEVWSEIADYKDFRTVVESTVRQGLYVGNSDKWLNDTVVLGSYPLHPAALFALPRVAMNLTSSNKTAFNFFTDNTPGGLSYFLNNFAVVQPNGRLHLYTVDWLCTYFEKIILKDEINSFYATALQSAILSAGDVPQSRRILRLIMILQLIGHDRLRPTLDTIVWALHLGEREERIVRRSVEMLCQKKTLNFSEATGEYLLPVPQRKVDVGQSIQRNRNRMRSQIDLRQEIQKRLPSLRIVANGYNAKYNTDRAATIRAFYASEVENANDFLGVVDDLVGKIRPYRGDVLLAFVLADSSESMEKLQEGIKAGQYNHQRLVMVVPTLAHRFAKDIVEVRCLERMIAQEPPFNDSTTNEHAQVAELLEKAKAVLGEYSDGLLSYENLSCYYMGEKIGFESRKQVEEWLDYNLPSLAGTPPIIAAADFTHLNENGASLRHRQALINYLLTSGENVGLRSDATMLKSLLNASLVQTGIVTKTAQKGFWTHYSLAKEIPDEGMGAAYNAIWGQIKDAAAKRELVAADALLVKWMRAPYAFTPALLELILAVILWQNPHDIHLCRNRLRAQAEDRPELLESVEPSTKVVADIVAEPADWMIGYSELDVHQERFLDGVCRIIGIDTAHEGSYWNYVGYGLKNWYAGLAPANRVTAMMKAGNLIKFSRFLDSAPNDEALMRDYVETKLPNALGEPPIFSWVAETDEMLERLKDLCHELAGQIERRRANLEKGLRDLFGDENVEWSESARNWLSQRQIKDVRQEWSVEFKALEDALASGKDSRTSTLIERLGYESMDNWQFDVVDEIVERMGALRKALDAEQYSRHYRHHANCEVARELGWELIKASGLSDEQLSDWLSDMIQALAWSEAVPEDGMTPSGQIMASLSSFEAQSDVIADPSEALVSTSAQTKAAHGDWLYADDEGTDLALVQTPLNTGKWKIGSSDLLYDDSFDIDDVVESLHGNNAETSVPEATYAEPQQEVEETPALASADVETPVPVEEAAGASTASEASPAEKAEAATENRDEEADTDIDELTLQWL